MACILTHKAAPMPNCGMDAPPPEEPYLGTQPKRSPLCKGHRFDSLLRFVTGPLGYICMPRVWRTLRDYIEAPIENLF